MRLNYHDIVAESMTNGSGIRVVLFVSGCHHHCEGCHNPQTWSPDSGVLFDNDAFKEIEEYIAKPYISGLTLSGGDPLEEYNRPIVTQLAQTLKTKYPEKSIWCYTGYNWEQVKDDKIMKYLDVLVDGRFLLKYQDVNLPHCGSTNQRVIDVQKSLQKEKLVIWDNSNP